MSRPLIMFNGVDLTTAGSVSNVTSAWRSDGIDAASDLAEQDIPRRQGSVVQAARKKSRTLKLVGQVGGAACTGDQIQTVLDAIRQATAPETGPQPLYAGRDDRYWLAQRESYSESWEQGLLYGVLADISMTFRAAAPDAYASTGLAGSPALSSITDTVDLSTSGTTDVTPAGDSAAHPVWSLTIAASATGTIVLANSLTGESMKISGTFSLNDTLTFDARESTYGAYLNGGLDYGLFSGPIPRLWPGVNPISLTLTTLSLSAASLSYVPRYG